ncbi:hypothetical protein TUN199_11918, partial [Pyrenophora tritici-repentis]
RSTSTTYLRMPPSLSPTSEAHFRPLVLLHLTPSKCSKSSAIQRQSPLSTLLRLIRSIGLRSGRS